MTEKPNKIRGRHIWESGQKTVSMAANSCGAEGYEHPLDPAADALIRAACAATIRQELPE